MSELNFLSNTARTKYIRDISNLPKIVKFKHPYVQKKYLSFDIAKICKDLAHYYQNKYATYHLNSDGKKCIDRYYPYSNLVRMYNNYANKLDGCSRYFNAVSDNNYNHSAVYWASRCHLKFCPICQFLLSRIRANKINTIFDYLMLSKTYMLKSGHPQFEPYFFTLTCKDIIGTSYSHLKHNLKVFLKVVHIFINLPELRGWNAVRFVISTKGRRKMITGKHYYGLIKGLILKYEHTDKLKYLKAIKSYVPYHHPHVHMIAFMKSSIGYGRNFKYSYQNKATWDKLWLKAINTYIKRINKKLIKRGHKPMAYRRYTKTGQYYGIDVEPVFYKDSAGTKHYFNSHMSKYQVKQCAIHSGKECAKYEGKATDITSTMHYHKKDTDGRQSIDKPSKDKYNHYKALLQMVRNVILANRNIQTIRCYGNCRVADHLLSHRAKCITKYNQHKSVIYVYDNHFNYVEKNIKDYKVMSYNVSLDRAVDITFRDIADGYTPRFKVIEDLPKRFKVSVIEDANNKFNIEPYIKGNDVYGHKDILNKLGYSRDYADHFILAYYNLHHYYKVLGKDTNAKVAWRGMRRLYKPLLVKENITTNLNSFGKCIHKSDYYHSKDENMYHRIYKTINGETHLYWYTDYLGGIDYYYYLLHELNKSDGMYYCLDNFGNPNAYKVRAWHNIIAEKLHRPDAKIPIDKSDMNSKDKVKSLIENSIK